MRCPADPPLLLVPAPTRQTHPCHHHPVPVCRRRVPLRRRRRPLSFLRRARQLRLRCHQPVLARRHPPGPVRRCRLPRLVPARRLPAPARRRQGLARRFHRLRALHRQAPTRHLLPARVRRLPALPLVLRALLFRRVRALRRPIRAHRHPVPARLRRVRAVLGLVLVAISDLAPRSACFLQHPSMCTLQHSFWQHRVLHGSGEQPHPDLYGAPGRFLSDWRSLAR